MNKIIKFFTRIKFQAILIFAFAFSFFLFFQFQIPDFLGRDAYYHIKIAKLFSQGKFVFRDFPWLYFTTLHQHFVDQHFLFHFFLAPFLFLGDFLSFNVTEGIEGDFLGARVATALFSSFAVLVFYLILQKNKVFAAFFWTISLLGASSGFIFRMNLIQAQGLAMVWLFLGFLALSRKKYLWLIPISFLYSWTHGGFILILVMVGVWSFGLIFFERVAKATSREVIVLDSARTIMHFLAPLGFTFLGLGLGILSHPYFPELLPFLKIQLFETGPFAKIQVGAEWYPYKSTLNLLLSSGLVFFFFTAAVFILLINKIFKKRFIEEKNSYLPILVSLIFSLSFLFLTLRSQRFIEYLTPFVLLFAAFTLAPILKRFFAKVLGQQSLKNFFVASLILVIILFFWSFSTFMTKKSFVGSYHKDYQEAALWLKNNTPKNSIVANLDWSDFPPLFYFNDQNYYVSGLDQIFFYKYNKNLYQKYEDIIDLKNSAFTSKILKDDFKTNYLVTNNKFPKLEEKIKNNRQFLKVYGNGYLRVYKIK
ncbi:MAG: hypothetical protein AB1465_05430 [Patescibacteria group bacterium]